MFLFLSFVSESEEKYINLIKYKWSMLALRNRRMTGK